MAFLDVYIGFTEGYSFEVDDAKFRIGNVPKRKSPFFPKGSSASRELREKISSGDMKGEQVDWGAWAAFVSKGEILAFMDELYSPQWQDKYREEQEKYGLENEYEELKDFVEKLSDDEKYILVASEL